MKTTVDIPDDLFREAARISKAQTKRNVIVHAIEELIRQEKKKRALAVLGTSDTMITLDELMDMRWERGRYSPHKKK